MSDADALRAAILDIDAHATPLHEDGDGFTTDCLVTAGCLHRALGLIGHTAAKVGDDALAADRLAASGGADQQDADPFAALRTDVEALRVKVARAEHRFQTGYNAAVTDVLALVAAIPGAPSTDPAPEPPTCSNCGTPLDRPHAPMGLGACYIGEPAPPAPEDGEA